MRSKAQTWPCACGAENVLRDRSCESCGEARPRGAGRQSASARVCEIDGGELTALGWCDRGQGYPITLPCPFACPSCRRQLSWDGMCLSCPREECLPGDRYEYGPARHWRKVEAGPRVCMTEAQNVELVGVVTAVLHGAHSEAWGHAEVDRIVRGEAASTEVEVPF